MHRGVQEFIRFVENRGAEFGLKAEPPATAADVLTVEQHIGIRLPEDLRLVLARFNGATLPSGALLSAGAKGTSTIEATLKEYAQRMGTSFLDPELLLPFHRTEEGNLLAFDRSAGPVPDTWPVVDFYGDTGEIHLVYRTFDGWCRACVEEWTGADFTLPFSLDKYLHAAERHVRIEPDVATAHATLAHARRRAGRPEAALDAYMAASRCVPPLVRCDWEALKVAALLGRYAEAFEAASRLCARGPERRWTARETTPTRVADVIGRVAVTDAGADGWLRLLDTLVSQTQGKERGRVEAIRDALREGRPLPPTELGRPSVVEPQGNPNALYEAVRAAYASGVLRDEDLLLDPALDPIRATHDLAEILRTRRDF